MAASADKIGGSILPLIDYFMSQQGRRPRILVVSVELGLQVENSQGSSAQNGGAKLIATAFADFGFDVDISPRCEGWVGDSWKDSNGIVRQAIENDVHVICISTQIEAEAVEYSLLSCVSELIRELKAQDADDILVIMSGDSSDEDHKALEQVGVLVCLRPNMQMLLAAKQVLKAISRVDY